MLLWLAVALVMSNISTRGAVVVFLTGLMIGVVGGNVSAPMFPTPPLTKFAAAPPDGMPADLAPTGLPERPTMQETYQNASAHQDAKGEDVSAPLQIAPDGSGDQTRAKTAAEQPSKTTQHDARTNPDTREDSGTKHSSVESARPNLARPDRGQERRRHRNAQRKYADASEGEPHARSRRGGRNRDREMSGKQKEMGSGCFLFFC